MKKLTTLTPDEARRFQQGELPNTELPLIERLKAELSNGVYAGDTRQQQAITELVVAWSGADCAWIHYMKDMKALYIRISQCFHDTHRKINVYDRIGDLDFWVRALAASPAFAGTSYVKALRKEHSFDEMKQLQAA